MSVTCVILFHGFQMNLKYPIYGESAISMKCNILVKHPVNTVCNGVEQISVKGMWERDL